MCGSCVCQCTCVWRPEHSSQRPALSYHLAEAWPLLLLLSRIVQACQPASSRQIFLSASHLTRGVLGLQTLRTTASFVRVLQACTATAFTCSPSLPPTFCLYVLQITQGLTKTTSIKVNGKGLSTLKAACLPRPPRLILAWVGRIGIAHLPVSCLSMVPTF